MSSSGFVSQPAWPREIVGQWSGVIRAGARRSASPLCVLFSRPSCLDSRMCRLANDPELSDMSTFLTSLNVSCAEECLISTRIVQKHTIYGKREDGRPLEGRPDASPYGPIACISYPWRDRSVFKPVSTRLWLATRVADVDPCPSTPPLLPIDFVTAIFAILPGFVVPDLAPLRVFGGAR